MCTQENTHVENMCLHKNLHLHTNTHTTNFLSSLSPKKAVIIIFDKEILNVYILWLWKYYAPLSYAAYYEIFFFFHILFTWNLLFYLSVIYPQILLQKDSLLIHSNISGSLWKFSFIFLFGYSSWRLWSSASQSRLTVLRLAS